MIPPYSLVPYKILRRVSSIFLGYGEKLEHTFKFLKTHLKQARFDISVKEYLSRCIASSLIFFIAIEIFLVLIFLALKINGFIGFTILISLIVTIFVFIQQLFYPKVIVSRKVKNLEKNLIPALQNILVQLNSGVPLFDILVNISKERYGDISKEFSIAVKQIYGGRPEIETLEEIAENNPSMFFRRAIWQIINGMKSGANMSKVIEETINLLSEEQILQIQRYGSQLNPLAMFYMLVVVIAPSLAIAFFIILSSFVFLTESTVKVGFWVIYGIILMFQFMFIGIIKGKRPNLLGE
ncbi:type II secretion system F family protein [Nanoarchaeota archaeon]